MAVHDVNMSKNNRSKAMPISHDTLSQRSADGTTSWSQKVNVLSEPRIVTRDARIVAYDENGAARIFFGIVPEFDNEPVLAISKDGYDVLEELGIS
jgi:hypothetical protein